ncbi:MAG: hypothetical protein ACKN9U_05580 [Pirellulaceae bacterium]
MKSELERDGKRRNEGVVLDTTSRLGLADRMLPQRARIRLAEKLSRSLPSKITWLQLRWRRWLCGSPSQAPLASS